MNSVARNDAGAYFTPPLWLGFTEDEFIVLDRIWSC